MSKPKKGKEETSTSFGKVIRRTVFFPFDTLASDESAKPKMSKSEGKKRKNVPIFTSLYILVTVPVPLRAKETKNYSSSSFKSKRD